MQDDSSNLTAQVVCFGMVTPATVLIVDELPSHNTGIQWKQAADFISDDAAIIAVLLKQWGVPTGLIATALGDDAPGRRTVRQLRDLGVMGEFRLSKEITTPYELNISDRTGARTYFWKRDPHVLATLDAANLTMVSGARYLYADWYDGDHVLRAMKEARRHNVPVFFNFEHGHEDTELLMRLAPYISVCQAVTDAAQLGDDPMDTAVKLLDAGIPTVIVTMAERGCLAATTREALRVYAPEVKVVDGCAAGATLSAGYIYGALRDWSLIRRLKFAVAAASLQCTVAGPKAFPITEIEALADSLMAE